MTDHPRSLTAEDVALEAAFASWLEHYQAGRATPDVFILALRQREERHAQTRRHGQDLLRWVRAQHDKYADLFQRWVELDAHPKPPLDPLERQRLRTDPHSEFYLADQAATKAAMYRDVLAEAARLGLGGEGTE